jgi:hypothetical protein
VASVIVGFATGYGIAHALGIPSTLGVSLGSVMGIVSAFITAENTVETADDRPVVDALSGLAALSL